MTKAEKVFEKIANIGKAMKGAKRFVGAITGSTSKRIGELQAKTSKSLDKAHAARMAHHGNSKAGKAANKAFDIHAKRSTKLQAMKETADTNKFMARIGVAGMGVAATGGYFGGSSNDEE